MGDRKGDKKGDWEGNREVDRNNRTGYERTHNHPLGKEKTLMEVYEQAVKEKPRDIDELWQRGRKGDKGVGEGDQGHNIGAKVVTWLEVRNKARKATEQAILRHNALLAEFRKISYKEALQKAIEEQARIPAGKPASKAENSFNNRGEKVLTRIVTKTRQQPDAEGWTEVRRKIRNTQANKPQASVQHWRQDLVKQGKCFNCLEKGHRKFECTSKIKCRLCTRYGHVSNSCTSAGSSNGGVKRNPTTFIDNQLIKSNPGTQIAPHKPQLAQTQILTQEINHSNHIATTQNMDPLANWETMNPLKAGFFRRTETLAYRIVRKLASRFKMNPQHIKVRKSPPTMGDYLAIFPLVHLRNKACDICAFDRKEGAQIQLARWVKNSGMLPDPTTSMARLKVHDLPHQFWTKEDLTDLVAGFGTLERMSDFPQNENFKELRVSRMLPPDTYHRGDHSDSTTKFSSCAL